VRTRERFPLAWAMTQNNLGNALQTWGEREGSAEHLKEAVAAYRAALEVRARERMPVHWALTQINLGNALWTLADREKTPARLNEALAAYQTALNIFVRAGADYHAGITRRRIKRLEDIVKSRRAS
jgi:tetratricopeptide (TPR) repeat protein